MAESSVRKSGALQIIAYLFRTLPREGQAHSTGLKIAALLTHHDLRHLFATRCIESGVDIPTVSRWLGHKDGGALAMKVYGHLRDQHSVAMAQKVTFSASRPAPAGSPD